MADTPEYLASRLESEGEKTTAFFISLPPAAWGQAVYTGPESWSVHQVVAHLVSAEAAFTRLLEDIRSGGAGAPDDFDIDAYNQGEVAALAGIAPSELLQRFRCYRQENVTLVAKMSPSDLLKRGRHPFLGITELVEIIKLLYRHNQIHQRDVRRALATVDDRGV